MAINITDAGKLTKEETGLVARLEKGIDGFIKYCYENKNSVVSYKIPEEYYDKPRILNELKRRYTNAGWKVSLEEDSRTDCDCRGESYQERFYNLKLKARSKK